MTMNLYSMNRGDKLMTRKQLESKYDFTIFKDSGFDDNRKYWMAQPNDFENMKFDKYADGWNLKELEENILKRSIK